MSLQSIPLCQTASNTCVLSKKSKIVNNFVFKVIVNKGHTVSLVGVGAVQIFKTKFIHQNFG